MTDVREAAPTQTHTQQKTGGFIWYELMSPDPEGSKAFYDAVVGWNVGPAVPEFNNYRMIGRSDGKSAGGIMPLTAEMQEHGARPGWLGYIRVANVDGSTANIEQAGGKTYMAPFDIPNVGRIAMVADPGGAPFYIMTPTPPSNDPNAQSDVFSPDLAQHVRWNELSATDQPGAIAFYKRQFGWAQEGGMPMGEMGDYSFIQSNGVTIGAIMRKPPQLPVSTWTYYIGVDDIDRAIKAINDRGGRVLNGPHEIPGGEFALNGLDPQTAPFGLVGPRKS